jgi:hypothetical protein
MSTKDPWKQAQAEFAEALSRGVSALENRIQTVAGLCNDPSLVSEAALVKLREQLDKDKKAAVILRQRLEQTPPQT